MMKLIIGLAIFIITVGFSNLLAPLLPIKTFADQASFCLLAGLLAWAVYWAIIALIYGW